MWSNIVRIFLTVGLSIAFLVLFGQNNIKRYSEGGIAKIRNEEQVHQNDIPMPGKSFCFSFDISTMHNVYLSLFVVISIADTSNYADNKKVCRGDLNIVGCIKNDNKSKILETDPCSNSFYVDHFRKAYSFL